LVYLVATVSMSACVANGALKSDFDPAVPHIGHLLERVTTLYHSEQAHDWRACYLMTFPEIRNESSYDEFSKEQSSQTFVILGWNIRGISGEDDPDSPKGAHRAMVHMDVSVKERSGPLTSETDQTDYWLYLDGEWYWAWRGWPAD